MTTFDSLPLDMLLVVFRELEIIDFIRLGMVSPSLLSVAPSAHRSPFETEH